MRERVTGYAIISLYNSLVDGEVTGGVTGVNINSQPPAGLCAIVRPRIRAFVPRRKNRATQ